MSAKSRSLKRSLQSQSNVLVAARPSHASQGRDQPTETVRYELRDTKCAVANHVHTAATNPGASWMTSDLKSPVHAAMERDPPTKYVQMSMLHVTCICIRTLAWHYQAKATAILAACCVSVCGRAEHCLMTEANKPHIYTQQPCLQAYTATVAFSSRSLSYEDHSIRLTLLMSKGLPAHITGCCSLIQPIPARAKAQAPSFIRPR